MLGEALAINNTLATLHISVSVVFCKPSTCRLTQIKSNREIESEMKEQRRLHKDWQSTRN